MLSGKWSIYGPKIRAYFIKVACRCNHFRKTFVSGKVFGCLQLYAYEKNWSQISGNLENKKLYTNVLNSGHIAWMDGTCVASSGLCRELGYRKYDLRRFI